MSYVMFEASISKRGKRYALTVPKAIGEQLHGEEVTVVINGKEMFRGRVASNGDRFIIQVPHAIGEKLHKQNILVTLITTKPVIPKDSKWYMIIPTVFTTVQLQESKPSNEPITTVIMTLPYTIKSVKQEQKEEQTGKKKEVLTV